MCYELNIKLDEIIIKKPCKSKSRQKINTQTTTWDYFFSTVDESDLQRLQTSILSLFDYCELMWSKFWSRKSFECYTRDKSEYYTQKTYKIPLKSMCHDF